MIRGQTSLRWVSARLLLLPLRTVSGGGEWCHNISHPSPGRPSVLPVTLHDLRSSSPSLRPAGPGWDVSTAQWLLCCLSCYFPQQSPETGWTLWWPLQWEGGSSQSLARGECRQSSWQSDSLTVVAHQSVRHLSRPALTRLSAPSADGSQLLFNSSCCPVWLPGPGGECGSTPSLPPDFPWCTGWWWWWWWRREELSLITRADGTSLVTSQSDTHSQIMQTPTQWPGESREQSTSRHVSSLLCHSQEHGKTSHPDLAAVSLSDSQVWCNQPDQPTGCRVPSCLLVNISWDYLLIAPADAFHD